MTGQRVMTSVWTGSLVLVGLGLIGLTFLNGRTVPESSSWPLWAFLAMGLTAFLAEYVDSSLGMGYGTTLTPVLLILGFTPAQVVPAVLLSECLSGIAAGLLHHRMGNVNLRRGTRERKTMWVLAGCSLVGTVVAVAAALSLPKAAVKGYIGVMILVMGLLIIVGGRWTRRFSWRRIVGLGLLAAFNKGISGGGYGPLVTGGQVLAGVPEKPAVAITSLAEGMVCFVGLILYIALGGGIVWRLALPLALGACLSVPAATCTVRFLPAGLLRHSIGYATLFLGTLTLVKL